MTSSHRPRAGRTRSLWAPVRALLATTLLAPIAHPAHAAPGSTGPRADVFDVARRIDVNRLLLFQSNFGPLAWDVGTGNAGLVYPRGGTRTVVFASGLWIGATVGGATRATVSEYSSEYAPGAMFPGGGFENPSQYDVRSYKVVPYRGDPADTAHVERTPAELAADPLLDPLAHHSWSEYMAGAVPRGAPWRLHRLPDTSTPDPSDSVDVPGPEVTGDQMVWCVYNDADPAMHTNAAGSTPPLGVEVRQSTFAFDDPGPLGDAVFVRFVLLNRGPSTLQEAYIGLWSDPDVGGASDDLAGVDVGRAMGFAYNATNNDTQYGSTPPAVGFDLLAGPRAGNQRLGLTAFERYINGTDPGSATRTYYALRGLDANGILPFDPTTGYPTPLWYPGDPVTGTGWLDSNAADRRTLVASGPFAMAPGDTQVVELAIVVGRGVNRLASISLLRQNDDAVQAAYDNGLTNPPPPPVSCLTQTVNCPRPLDFWQDQCGGAGTLTARDLDRIAAYVSQSTAIFDWPVGQERASLCALLQSAEADARTRAKQQAVALFATLGARVHDIAESNGDCIRLNDDTPIRCPGVAPRTVGELAAPYDPTLVALLADYDDIDPAHVRPIAAVDWGGQAFGGGADYGIIFFDSTLDPYAMPDSFPRVELRFDGTQKAYRVLRRELSDGSPPGPGRGYLYGGYWDVPFTVWDTDTGTQLEAAFVERALANSDGTLSPDSASIATYDRTWSPDDSDTGGREYLFVLRRPYDGMPRPEFQRDGSVADGAWPLLYALWARRVAAGAVFDPADRFHFDNRTRSNGSLDERLVVLESQSLADPAVQDAYQQLIDCVAPITRGEGIGITCRTATPVLAVTVESDAGPDGVRLRWYAPTLTGAMLERSEAVGPWSALATLSADGEGYLAYQDRDVAAGRRYGYRLRARVAGQDAALAEVWVQVPDANAGQAATLALAGFRPNPARAGEGSLIFTLASRAPATLAVYDVRGRLRWIREVGSLGPGTHAIRLDEAVGVPGGICFLRLTQDGRTLTARGVMAP